jgi:tryptophan-rich sensory protein
MLAPFTKVSYPKTEERKMDASMIRIIAGVLAVVVLFIIIWRRKKKALD